MRDILSVIILTKNEEKNIIDCVESLNFADEILIIDDNSTDRTVELAQSLNNKNVKILSHKLDNDFSTQRNFALEKTTGEWVLYVDADERVDKKLQKEILYEIEQSSFDAYSVVRRDFLWNKALQYGETANLRFIRLAKKNAGKWTGRVHEVWNIRGKVGGLQSELVHYPHPTIHEFLSEINYYTTMRADELLKAKTLVSSVDIFLFPAGKFFVNYIVKQGFRDGVHGFIHATLMSFHSFLVRGKVYLLNSYEKK